MLKVHLFAEILVNGHMDRDCIRRVRSQGSTGWALRESRASLIVRRIILELIRFVRIPFEDADGCAGTESCIAQLPIRGLQFLVFLQ